MQFMFENANFCLLNSNGSIVRRFKPQFLIMLIFAKIIILFSFAYNLFFTMHAGLLLDKIRSTFARADSIIWFRNFSFKNTVFQDVTLRIKAVR